MLGRPYAYGLAVGGEQGVSDVLANLIADTDLTLGLAGCTSVCGSWSGESHAVKDWCWATGQVKKGTEAIFDKRRQCHGLKTESIPQETADYPRVLDDHSRGSALVASLNSFRPLSRPQATVFCQNRPIWPVFRRFFSRLTALVPSLYSFRPLFIFPLTRCVAYRGEHFRLATEESTSQGYYCSAHTITGLKYSAHGQIIGYPAYCQGLSSPKKLGVSRKFRKRSQSAMATAAQIDANRRNAQKSTGPRTEEGKNRSRMNSLDHGGRASILVLPPEEFAQYEEWRLAWKKAFRPRSAAEEVLIDRITALDWQEKWIERASCAAQLAAGLAFDRRPGRSRARTSTRAEPEAVSRCVRHNGAPHAPGDR